MKENKRHESKQLLGDQQFGLTDLPKSKLPYVDSEGYMYYETENGVEYPLNEKGERVKFREDDEYP